MALVRDEEDADSWADASEAALVVTGQPISTRPLRFGFVGGGMMADAMLTGWLSRDKVTARSVMVADVCPASRARFEKKGVTVVSNNNDVAHFADVIVIAVKPNVVPHVLREIGPLVDSSKLILSIAAGVTSGQMEEALDHRLRPVRVIRVMPNTPCQVGESAAAFCVGQSVLPEDTVLARELFQALGTVVEVAEHQMDAVTGLAGSGPAFVYMAIEALADGGVRAGLPRDLAMKLACQVVQGSARMVTVTGTHPGALKDAVCSPGGTTIAGVHALERSGFRAALMDAVVHAAERSSELGRKK